MRSLLEIKTPFRSIARSYILTTPEDSNIGILEVLMYLYDYMCSYLFTCVYLFIPHLSNCISLLIYPYLSFPPSAQPHLSD